MKLTEKQVGLINAMRALENQEVEVTSYSVAEILGVKTNSVTIQITQLTKKGLIEEDGTTTHDSVSATGTRTIRPIKKFKLTELGKTAELEVRVDEKKAVTLSADAEKVLNFLKEKPAAIFQVGDELFDGNIKVATGVVIGLSRKGLIEKTEERVERRRENGIDLVNLYKFVKDLA